jgi:glycosyltransferase involved in cell wall biosynthesis
MKKVLVTGPFLSRSGYGEMGRFALRALRNNKDVDLYALPTNWGNTGWLHEDNEERKWFDEVITKTALEQHKTNNQPNFDISIQITIPNEWKKLAPINIGYTAGIETNLISPAWLQPTQQMDKIIVISEHAKAGFINTIFGNPQGQQFKVTTPVEVVHLPYRNVAKKELNLHLKYDFNFLCVCQWGPRKNLDQAIVGFLQEFKNEEVGLLLKINTVNDSIIDRNLTEKRLKDVLSNFPDRKCSVTLLHGHLSEEEMEYLYTHPKIKAIVSTTHGEGFGLPLLEAAANELPVIAPDWSGHVDFLYMQEGDEKKRMFGKIDYDLKPIEQQHVWQGVLEAGTQWAYPKMVSYKERLRDCYKDWGRYKSQAKKLAPWIKDNFSQQKLQDVFFYALGIFAKPLDMPIEKLDGISFCIPTNAKRLDKLNLLIKSIKRQNWNELPYEIIISGDVSSIQAEDRVLLLNHAEAAHTRKVALLRNRAAEKAKYNNIVFCDDDILLESDWLEELLKYSTSKGWNVLSNKVLSLDGTRYWDRATLNPHKLVNYNHNQFDKALYQSSAFFMVKKKVFDMVKWDETKLVYADRMEKQIPEDVQYTLDLYNSGYYLSFNENALVWHNDDRYTSINEVTLLKQVIKDNNPSYTFADPHYGFTELVRSLQ